MFFRLREGGGRPSRPYSASKHGWIAAELVRLKRFVFCLLNVLQAELGAGGHRRWAVIGRKQHPAGEHWGWHCLSRRAGRLEFYRPRRGPGVFHC